MDKKKSEFFYVSDGALYVKVKLKEQFDAKDKYWKRNYLVILTKSDAKDNSGDTFYNLDVYKHENHFFMREKSLEDGQIKEFLGDFENVQTISGDNLALITKGDN